MKKSKAQPRNKRTIWLVIFAASLVAVLGYATRYLWRHAQVAEVSTGTPVQIQSTFISLPDNKQLSYTDADWYREFVYMQHIGIETLIVDAAYIKDYANPAKAAIYRSELYKTQRTKTLHLDIILDLASQFDMKVYISPVNLNNHWAKGNEIVDLSKSVVSELSSLGYTKHPSFAGWYLYAEPPLNQSVLDYNHWKDITVRMRQVTPGKKIIVAPYYIPPCANNPARYRCENPTWPDKDPAAIAQAAKNLIVNIDADILAVQDGMGASGVTLSELDQYIPAISAAVKSVGKEFWVDVEIFRPNSARTQFVPATIADLAAQLSHLQPYYKTMWVFNQFMGPNYSEATNKLYQDYISHYQFGPLPPSATPQVIFTDVMPYHWAFAPINAMYTYKITGGCSASPLKYCPDSKVNRAEAAIFLVRAQKANTSTVYQPPTPPTQRFSDVQLSAVAAPYIEIAAQNGITAGCGSGKYCPNALLTRAQAAIMLVRSKMGPSYQPRNEAIFGDVPTTHWAAPWIAELSRLGIVSGCGNGNFCPDREITRAELAYMIVRAFSLPTQQ